MTFFNHDPQDAFILFRFIGGIGLCLGIIIFALMRFPSTRRQQFSQGPGCSTFSSLFVAFLIIGGAIYFGWRASGGRFITAEVGNGEVILHYVLPKRQKSVPISDIAKIASQHRGKMNYGAVIRTHSGEAFLSISTSRYQLRPELEAFRNEVRRMGGTF